MPKPIALGSVLITAADIAKAAKQAGFVAKPDWRMGSRPSKDGLVVYMREETTPYLKLADQLHEALLSTHQSYAQEVANASIRPIAVARVSPRHPLWQQLDAGAIKQARTGADGDANTYASPDDHTTMALPTRWEG